MVHSRASAYFQKTGEKIFEIQKIRERWFEYGKTLYRKDGALQPQQDAENHRLSNEPENPEPPVMLSEVRKAVNKLKNNKAPGLDEVSAEMIKAGGETSISVLKSVIDQIWTTGDWPEDWVISELVPLPKVAGTMDCAKHRTISLLAHASKVLLEILRSRLAYFITPQIADEQFGFVSEKGTPEAILVFRNLIEKNMTRQKPEIWIMFIDYEKAFDTVDHDMLWQALEEIGVPQHLIWLVRKLYERASGVIRVLGEHTKSFNFEKGVRQGCILSPMLFNVCGECIMRTVQEKLCDRMGVVVGGRVI